MVFKTHVNGSQIVVDKTPSLPECETIEVMTVDELLARGGDLLDEEERAALHFVLNEAEEDIKSGRYVSENEMWSSLRANT